MPRETAIVRSGLRCGIAGRIASSSIRITEPTVLSVWASCRSCQGAGTFWVRAVTRERGSIVALVCVILSESDDRGHTCVGEDDRRSQPVEAATAGISCGPEVNQECAIDLEVENVSKIAHESRTLDIVQVANEDGELEAMTPRFRNLGRPAEASRIAYVVTEEVPAAHQRVTNGRYEGSSPRSAAASSRACSSSARRYTTL